MKKKLALLSLLILILAGGLFFFVKTRHTYSKELVPIQSVQELNNLLDKKTKKIPANQFVYLGRPTCDYCNKFKPELEKAIKEEKVTVYDFNTDQRRKEKGYDEILNKLEVNKVPLLISLKNTKNRYYEKTNLVDIKKFMKECEENEK